MKGKSISPAKRFLLAFVLSVAMSGAIAESLVVVEFNVEFGGADPDVVDEQIARIDGVDLWGLSEVGDAEKLFENPVMRDV